MTDDLRIGIILLEVFQQEEDSGFLSLSTGVGGASFLIETSFVADADGMLVVVLDVGAGNPFRTTFMVFAITGDVPVVAAVVGVAFCAVTALQVIERKVFVAAGCTTVEDEPLHILHWENFFLFHKRILLEVIPIGDAGLHSKRSKNSSDYCCSEFQNLCDFGPIYFYHFILKLNLT